MDDAMIMEVARAISDADQTCDGDYRKLAEAAIEAYLKSLNDYHNHHPMTGPRNV